MKKRIMTIILINFLWLPITTQAQVAYGMEDIAVYPIYGAKGMVSSQEALATRIGVDILKNGGNAVDAAVAIGFTLAVTLPQAGNIGGGGFMLLQLQDGTTTSIDFREKAPLKATRDMFLDQHGEVDGDQSLTSYRAVGVPGTVAGLLYALETYGTKERADVLNPAIELAAKGIEVSRDLAQTLARYGAPVMAAHPSSRAIFFADAHPLGYNAQLQQTDLAATLTRIRNEGATDFYHGETAARIVAHMMDNGGLITKEDLAQYTIVERAPITGTYKDYEISSMAPPSSGGLHIIQLLNILENFDLKTLGHNSADSIQIMVEAMKYAYADRTLYLGDPDFNDIPVAELVSKSYAKAIADIIRTRPVTDSVSISPLDLAPFEGDQTTHYSVMDQWGNAVAVTYTLNTNFGTGIVAEGTGILLNNQMDDFSAKPGVSNVYGLIGAESNAIAPEKRPLSSMSPTIVRKAGKPFIVTGSPGGSRIITTVLQVLLNTLEFEMNIAEASSAPRIHHQWVPDYIRVEKTISPDTIKLLKNKGYTVNIEPVMGSTQSIMRTEVGFFGASDPRTDGDLSLGF